MTTPKKAPAKKAPAKKKASPAKAKAPAKKAPAKKASASASTPAKGKKTGKSKEELAQARKDAFAERKRRLASGEAQVQHGTDSTYVNWGCRCDECKAAHTKADAERRARKAQLGGTTERKTQEVKA